MDGADRPRAAGGHRKRSAEPDRRWPIAAAIAMLLLVVLVAGFGLSHLAVSRHRPGSDKAQRPTTSSTTAAPITTTTTLRVPVQYQVRAGDTLTAIAKRFGVVPGAIVLANRLTGPDHLTIGQTLTIPSPPLVRLVLTPPSVAPGREVTLMLRGAQAREAVRFTFAGPGGTFTGPVHVASPRGTVTAAYTPGIDDPVGTTRVTAVGAQGTTAGADLVVRSAPPG